MNESRIYLFWLIPCSIVIGVLIYFCVRPVTPDWLLENVYYLDFVDEYQQIEPVITHWRNEPPATTNLAQMWQLAAERPWAYLPDAELNELVAHYSPTEIEKYVQRVTTVLISPCSLELKRRVLLDPLRLSERIYEVIKPATTSQCPVLFVCTLGTTKDKSLENAEAVERVLAELENAGTIGNYQGISSFIASKDKQSGQLAKFIRTIDTFQWYSCFENEIEIRGLDPKLFTTFFQNMRTATDAEQTALTVSHQQAQLTEHGLDGIVNAYFYVWQDEYLSVYRVLPVRGGSIEKTHDLLAGRFSELYIPAVISGPEYILESYHTLMREMFINALLVTGLGMLVIFALLAIRRIIMRVILGSEVHARVKHYTVQPRYQEQFSKSGLSHFEHLIGIERFVEQQGFERANLEPMRIHARRSGGYARRIDRITFPADGDGNEQILYYIKRATGKHCQELRKEYRILRAMEKKCIPVSPVVAYGEGIWHGEDMAVLVIAHLHNYTQLQHWQVFEAPKLKHTERRMIVEKLTRTIAGTIRACHCNSFFNLQIQAKHIYFKMEADGTAKVRLIDVEKVKRPMMISRVLAMVAPFIVRRLALPDLALLNRHLFLTYWTFRDRLRMYRHYSQRTTLSRYDKRILRAVMSRSRKKGYFPYNAKVRDININLEEYRYYKPFEGMAYMDYMKMSEGERITKKRDRTVYRIEKEECAYFLKRHAGTPITTAIGLLLRYRRPMSNARLEWEAIELMEMIGIRTVPAVAAGEKLTWRFWEENSFLLTAKLPDGESLEAILGRGERLGYRSREELAQRIGGLARRLHKAGYAHRDFYLGHIYAVGGLAGKYTLHLLDLQRVMRGARLYNHWSLKDMTALYFSSTGITAITNSDRMRVVKSYLGIGILTPKAKRFIHKILKKSERVERHTKKLLARRRARGELPACNL